MYIYNLYYCHETSLGRRTGLSVYSFVPALESTRLRLYLNKHMKHDRAVSHIALPPAPLRIRARGTVIFRRIRFHI